MTSRKVPRHRSRVRRSHECRSLAAWPGKTTSPANVPGRQHALRRREPPRTVRSSATALWQVPQPLGEAQWLAWSDVDFKANVVHVRAKDGWKPKTGDERAVPMSPKLIMRLRRLPRRGKWVLTAKATKKYPQEGRQISERRALTALKRVLSQLGIDGKLHSFRHSFISRCLTKGIEEAVLRSWVGHVDPSIMRVYTHITSKVSQDRIKLLGEPASGQDSASGDTKTA